MPLTYLKGDATVPQGKGPKLIAHIVNSLGGWGRGFVVSVSRQWSEPEKAYRQWFHARNHKDVYGSEKSFSLGHNQVVLVTPDIWVVNMLAQEGMGMSKGPPIRYDALALCLVGLNKIAFEKEASIHMPRIGCSLGGGDWRRVEPIIKQMLENREVFVYDYPGSIFNP